MRLRYEWSHARKRWAGILGDFEKKQFVEIRSWARLVEIWTWTRRVEIRTWASPVGSTGCAVRLLGQMELSAY